MNEKLSPADARNATAPAAEIMISPRPPKLPPKPSMPTKKPQGVMSRTSVEQPKVAETIKAEKPISAEPQSKKQNTDHPFERMCREDKLLYDCLMSLGRKRAVFVENIDWIQGIFREKAISHLDHSVIATLKELIPHLARPCDILFKDKASLMVKDKLTEADLQALIKVKESLGQLVKDLNDGISAILLKVHLIEKTQQQLKELPRLVQTLHAHYETAMTTLLESTKENRAELLTSNPHIKGPHLPYPIEISRKMANLMNSVDDQGKLYKENTTGAHRVTNTTVDTPSGHDSDFDKRFISSDNKIRLFFKRNVDPILEYEYILPATERKNGAAVRVHDANATPSTWFVLAEGTEYRDKDGVSEIHYASDVKDDAQQTVTRNVIQVSLGVQGHAFEDIYFLINFNQQLEQCHGKKEFVEVFNKLCDCPAAFQKLEGQPWFESIKHFENSPTPVDQQILDKTASEYLIAFRETLKKFSQDQLPKEGQLFLDINSERKALDRIKDYLKQNKPRQLTRLIAQMNAVPESFKGQYIVEMLRYTNQIPIMRYYFPQCSVELLFDKFKNIADLISDSEFYKWLKATFYGFSDCTGGNVFLEVTARDPATGETVSATPVDIDHAEGPEHEVVSRETKVKGVVTEKNYFVQFRCIAQLLSSKMKRPIPKELIEEDLQIPQYFCFAEFLKFLAMDRADNKLCLERGIITPSDYHFKYAPHEGSQQLEENDILDLFSKFHDRLYLDIFKRYNEMHSFLLTRKGKQTTFEDLFLKLFPIAGPTYQKLLAIHGSDISSILEALRSQSVKKIFGAEYDDPKFIKMRAQLEGRNVDLKDHITARTLTLEEMINKLHVEGVSLKEWEWDTSKLLEFCDIVGRHFPQPEILLQLPIPVFKDCILKAASEVRPAALWLLLKGFKLLKNQDPVDMSYRALSKLIQARTSPDQLRVRQTCDILLRSITIAENSPVHVKELLEKKRLPYYPIIELARGNEPYRQITASILKKLVNAGFSIESRDDNGLSALDHAVLENSVEMFNALVQNGAWKFLNEIKVVNFLIENSEDYPQNSPIFKAIMKNNRVAAEWIKRIIFSDDRRHIPVRTIEGDRFLSKEFIDYILTKEDKASQEAKSLESESEPAGQSKSMEKQAKLFNQDKRAVLRAPFQNICCHVKSDPEFPIFVLFAEQYIHDLIGFGSSISHVVLLDNSTVDTLLISYKKNTENALMKSIRILRKLERPIFLQISNTVEGQTFDKAMTINQGNVLSKDEVLNEEQLANYMRLALVCILLVLRDLKPDNILKSNDLRFCLIDIAINSLPAFVNDKLMFMCALFNKNEMYRPLITKVIYEFLSVDDGQFLLRQLTHFDQLLNSFMTHFKGALEIPAELNTPWVFDHATRFKDMRTALRKSLERSINDDEPFNLMEILQRTYSDVWLAYRDGNSKGTNELQRFIETTQSTASILRRKYAGTVFQTANVIRTAVMKSASAIMSKETVYDPKKALSDFKQISIGESEVNTIRDSLIKGDLRPFLKLRANVNKTFVSLDEIRQKIINSIDYAKVTPENQGKILKCLISPEGIVDFKELKLLNMTGLDIKTLEALLGNCTLLRELSLRGCTGLNTEGTHFRIKETKIKKRFKSGLRDIIAQKSSYLVSLDLSGSFVDEIKFAGKNTLKYLEYLYLDDCPYLTRAHIDSEFLKHLSLERNPELRRISITSEVLKVLNIIGCNNLPPQVLQQLIMRARQLTRFTFKAGENFHHRLLSWLVFEGWQPDVSRLSTQPRLNRHLLKAMIDHEGALKLGALPITQTDLEQIADLLASPENIKDPLNCRVLDLRGLETFHRETIRRLYLEMATGKNSLVEIKCQPRFRPKVGVEPKHSKISDENINDILISPEGQWVTACEDGNIRYIDHHKIGTNEVCLNTLKCPMGSAFTLLFTPSGDLLSGGSKNLILWDHIKGTPAAVQNNDQGDHVFQLFNSNGKIVGSMFRNIITVWNIKVLKQRGNEQKQTKIVLEVEKSYSHSGSNLADTGRMIVLPNQQVIFTSDKSPGALQIWNQAFLSKNKEFEPHADRFVNFKISHHNTLLATSKEKILEWDFQKWDKAKLHPTTMYQGSYVITRIPAEEYLVEDNPNANTSNLLILNSEFNPVCTLASVTSCFNAACLGPEGQLVYTTSKGEIFCMESQTTELTADLLKKFVNTFKPMMIYQTIYFPFDHIEYISIFSDWIDALFKVKISIVSGYTIKIDFPNESDLIAFLQYWYQLKGHSLPEQIINLQQDINIWDLKLSLHDVICIAENSPHLINIQGLVFDDLTAEHYTNIFGRCPSLTKLSGELKHQSFEIDINYRVLLPRCLDIEQDNMQLSIKFTRKLDSFQFEAWNSCVEFLKWVFPNSYYENEKQNQCSFKFNSIDQTNQCRALLDSLLTHRDSQISKHQDTTNGKLFDGLKRHSFLKTQRRSSTEYTSPLTSPRTSENLTL